MSTGTPLIETVISNIETDLKAISPINSFRTKPQIISRELQGFDEINDFPALFLSLDRIETQDETNKEIKSNIHLVIYGYVRYNPKGTDTDGAQTQLINLIADIIEKLKNDITRGVGALSTTFPSIITDRGTFEPLAAFIMEVVVELDFVGTDTTTNYDD